MAKDFSKLRVLVIDDNRHMRALLRAQLYAFGVRGVFEANDGEQGLDILQSEHPDLVITDYSMKPMNGAEFATKVRRLPAPFALIPVIMVTGHSERHYVEQARDAGVTEFLCKPITVRDLEARMTEIMERPRSFVQTETFVGPDRRRRRVTYDGPRRRRDEIDVELL